MTEVIEAQEQHVEAVAALWVEMMKFHAALNRFYTLRADAHESFEEFLRANIALPDSLVLAAVDGSTVVGFSLSFIKPYPPVFMMEKHGFISDFAVTERYRSQRIGTRMVERVKEWFFARGITRIELLVSTFNDRGRCFWERQGFSEHEAILFFSRK